MKIEALINFNPDDREICIESWSGDKKLSFYIDPAGVICIQKDHAGTIDTVGIESTSDVLSLVEWLCGDKR